MAPAKKGAHAAAMDAALSTETIIRLGCFLGLFAALAVCEAAFPRRARAVSRRLRWLSNVAVSTLNQAFLRVVLPASAVALAVYAQQQGWGLLGRLTLPSWLEIAVAVLVLDLAIYVQHVLYHRIPILWRFHRMHHADIDFDVTTGIRFHPVSVLLSGFIKLGVVVVLGPAPLAVLIFEVLLNATSLFNHSNLKIPVRAERLLRLLVVTPDMHRVHHSSDPAETNRNFGFNFPWWDKLFRTYRAQPALGHEGMVVGLEQFRETSELRLDRMLTQPFRGRDTLREAVENKPNGL